MKTLKKIFKYIALIFSALLIGITVYILYTTPKLSEETESIIDSVLIDPLPELITGETGFVYSGNTKIWYENIVPNNNINKGAIMLFMGISNDALGWPNDFIEKLNSLGYQVIRFDYRGTGMSDWNVDPTDNPYSMNDLANDSRIILDSLKIEKVNLVGISLGGMVAQEFAINFPERTHTLTSIMSSGNIVDNNLPGMSLSTLLELVKVGIRYNTFTNEENTIKLHVSSRIILRGKADYDIDVKGISEQVLYDLRNRNGYNPDASAQQQEATYLSGSRYESLKHSSIPLLIIHGLNDPLIPIDHSKKLESIIPNAKTKWFDNMGHDLPPYLIDSISMEIINHIELNNHL